MKVTIEIKNVLITTDFSLESFFMDHFNNDITNFSLKPGWDQTITIEFEIIKITTATLLQLSEVENILIPIIFFSCPYVEVIIKFDDSMFLADPTLISFNNSLNTQLSTEKFSKIKNIFDKIDTSDSLANIKGNLTLLSRTTGNFNKYKYLFAVFEEIKSLLAPNEGHANYKPIALKLKDLSYDTIELDFLHTTDQRLFNTQKKIDFSEKLHDALLKSAPNEVIWEYLLECMAVVRNKINHGKINKINLDQLNTSYKLLYKVIVELILNIK
jgi:hypothetical protein